MTKKQIDALKEDVQRLIEALNHDNIDVVKIKSIIADIDCVANNLDFESKH